LKKHLRDHWAGALLRSGAESWPPISVDKVGEAYFVEEGHQRVSVANFLGLAYVQAEVWKYPPSPDQAQVCQPIAHQVARRRIEVAPAQALPVISLSSNE